MKLLIDECLSAELAKLARDRGYPESSHVHWIGKAGAKDWELLPVILEGDWTFVTRSGIDFRGPPNAPGSRGEYRKATVHAGLICLNGPVGMDLDLQRELFEAALDALGVDADLINQVLEVALDDASDVALTVLRYALPAELRAPISTAMRGRPSAARLNRRRPVPRPRPAPPRGRGR